MRKKIKNINVDVLQQWQKDAFNLLLKHPKNSIITIKSHRQSGKSFLDILVLLFFGINHKGSESILISPTIAQARKVFVEILKIVENIPIVKSSNASFLDIEFVNGSVIRLRSAEQKDSLRGYSVTGILILDEFSYCSDELYGIVSSFVNVSRSSILITSTPFLTSGLFYDFYMKGLRGEENMYSFDVCSYDTSFFLSEEQKKLFKETMSPLQYQSEIEGEFLDNQSGVFGNFDSIISDYYDTDNHIYYIGVDFAATVGGDFTSIAVFNNKKQMVDLIYFNDKDATQTIDTISNVIRRYKPKKVTVESNSIGNVYFDLLRKKSDYPITKFTTTNDTKRRIIENLSKLIQNKEVTLLNLPELKKELQFYEIQRTKNGSVTYNGHNGVHDDLIMSIAICLHSICNNGQYVCR